MKISLKKFCKHSRESIRRCCTIFFLFVFLSGPGIIAQETSAPDTSAKQGEPAPDFKNIKNNLAKIKEAQRIQAHEEFMGYVYMILGFGLVIAVAWFSTVKIKQITERKEAAKRKFLEDKIARQGGKIIHPHRRGGHKR